MQNKQSIYVITSVLLGRSQSAKSESKISKKQTNKEQNYNYAYSQPEKTSSVALAKS